VGQGRANKFAAARGDKTVMRPFAKLLWKLVKFSSTEKFGMYATVHVEWVSHVINDRPSSSSWSADADRLAP